MTTEHEDHMARMQAAFDHAVRVFGRESPQANMALRDMARYAEVHGLPMADIVRGEIDGAVPSVKRES